MIAGVKVKIVEWRGKIKAFCRLWNLVLITPVTHSNGVDGLAPGRQLSEPLGKGISEF